MSKCQVVFKRHRWIRKNEKIICSRCGDERNPKANEKMLRLAK